MLRSPMITYITAALIAVVLIGCGGEQAEEPGTKFGLSESQRIEIYHEVENAIAANERAGREEIPAGGPECIEYINCLDDESKLKIAKKYDLTAEQLEDIVFEGEGSGWSQW